MRPGSVVVLLVLGLTACGGRDAPVATSSPSPTSTATPPTSPSPTFDVARSLIDTDEGSVIVDVEMAVKPEQQTFGLMFRESLPPDAGMVFLFFEEHSGGFWMKNTLIPLSIAFFDEEGEIVRILDMEPCKNDPCKIYDPGVGYWGALEVNQGAFERWGVEEGDVIHIPQ